MGRFFKFFPNVSSNLRKFWKKSGDFAQKFGPVGIWMGHFFLKKIVWVYFQIPRQPIHTKTKREYPQEAELPTKPLLKGLFEGTVPLPGFSKKKKKVHW